MKASCFSQIGYPKKIKIGNDSVVAITYLQLTYMNETYVKSVRYEQISDSLLVASQQCDSLYRDGQELVTGLKSEVIIQKTIAGKNQELADKNFQLFRQEEKKSKRLRTWMGIGGAGAGAVIIALVVAFLAK